MTFSKIAKKCVFFTSFVFMVTLAQSWVPATAAGPQVNKAAVSSQSNAPDFELQDLNGANVTLASFKGKKPVLLYFWASWCPYCMSVRPTVVNLRNTVPQSDLEILAINVGGGDSLAKVKRFQEAHPSPYPVLFDGDGAVVRSYQVQGIPLFVLVDKTGAVKFRSNEPPPDPMSLLK